MTTLRPCPFCGNNVQWNHNLDWEITGIYCVRCKAMVKFPVKVKRTDTYGDTMNKWAEFWNRRDGDPT